MMRSMLLGLAVVVLAGCSWMPPADTGPRVCIVSEPTLPYPNEEGDVVLSENDQVELLTYIETLEYCLEQAS